MTLEQHDLPAELFMDLERSGPIPLYFQISQRLERSIVNGDLPAGSRLENEVALSIRLGLSRPTIRRAIQELVDKGLLVRRRGIGTQVVHGQVTRNVELTSLYDDLANSAKRPSTRLLQFEETPADARIADKLAARIGAPVLHIRRVRLTDDVPVAIMENWLPAEFLDIPADDLVEHGLYQVLRARGITMRVAKQRIGARSSAGDESALLGLDPLSPLLTMERAAYDSSGRAVEFGRHCYRPDRYSFEVTLVGR